IVYNENKIKTGMTTVILKKLSGTQDFCELLTWSRAVEMRRIAKTISDSTDDDIINGILGAMVNIRKMSSHSQHVQTILSLPASWHKNFK
ncbi:MAG: hypothetical protein K2N34_09460, partial [Lachnospiraceae bacterium]|nr:hypothetical protein [Lachnospiraceae bacterium]